MDPEQWRRAMEHVRDSLPDRGRHTGMAGLPQPDAQGKRRRWVRVNVSLCGINRYDLKGNFSELWEKVRKLIEIPSETTVQKLHTTYCRENGRSGGRSWRTNLSQREDGIISFQWREYHFGTPAQPRWTYGKDFQTMGNKSLLDAALLIKGFFKISLSLMGSHVFRAVM